jgi:hypothetical protein
MNVNTELKKILSGCYCGVSLTYESDKKKFMIFTGGDTHLNIDEMAEGKTVSETVENFKKNTRNDKLSGFAETHRKETR